MALSNLLTRLLPAGALGATAAVLVSCGGGGTGLIPAADAGPLQTDFNDVGQAVSNGDCHGTLAALHRARHDFGALPPTVDAGLRRRLSDGLINLDHTAPHQCGQSSTSSTSPSATQTTPPPTTQSTPSTTDTTTAPPTTSSTNTSSQTQPSPGSSSPSGGTPTPPNPPTGGTHGPGDGGKHKGNGGANGNAGANGNGGLGQ